MKERGRLLRGDMVRAVLDGRKTQTREPVKNMPQKPDDEGAYFDAYNGGPFWNWWLPDNRACLPQIASPFGVPKDILYVRETWKVSAESNHYPSDTKRLYIEYRANRTRYQRGNRRVQTEFSIKDDDELARKAWGKRRGWRASIHMPRWASRIDLEVLRVWVERLQDISEADARAEGVEPVEWSEDFGGNPGDFTSFRQGFHDLWDSIYAKRGLGWDANPWIWACEFRRVKP